MADQTKPVWVDGKRVWVPADATEDEINTLFPAPTPPPPPSRVQQVLESPAAQTAKGVAIAGGAIPAATRAAWAVAKSDLPEYASAAARAVNWASPLVAGTVAATKFGPLAGAGAAATEIPLAALAHYRLGRGAYWAGQALRNAAGGVARAGEAVQEAVPSLALKGAGRAALALQGAEFIRGQWAQDHPDEAKRLSYGQQMVAAHKDWWHSNVEGVKAFGTRLRQFVGLTPAGGQ